MKTMLSTIFSLAFCLATLGAAFGQQPVSQQPPKGLPAVMYESYQKDFNGDDMQTMLTTLQKSTHLSFICEDWPGRSRQSLPVKGTVWAALNAITAAYHCDWKLMSGTSMVLIERTFVPAKGYWVNASQVPQLNQPELVRMVRNMIAAVNLVGAPLSIHEQIGAMRTALGLLSPSQHVQLTNSNGLALGAMPVASRRLIERVITSRLLGSTVWHWSRALYALEHVDLWKVDWQPARVSGESTGPHNGPLRPVVTPETGTFNCPIPGEQPFNF